MDFVLQRGRNGGYALSTRLCYPKNVTLEDLNSLYFGPVDRTLQKIRYLSLNIF